MLPIEVQVANPLASSDLDQWCCSLLLFATSWTLENFDGWWYVCVANGINWAEHAAKSSQNVGPACHHCEVFHLLTTYGTSKVIFVIKAYSNKILLPSFSYLQSLHQSASHICITSLPVTFEEGWETARTPGPPRPVWLTNVHKHAGRHRSDQCVHLSLDARPSIIIPRW